MNALDLFKIAFLPHYNIGCFFGVVIFVETLSKTMCT